MHGDVDTEAALSVLRHRARVVSKLLAQAGVPDGAVNHFEHITLPRRDNIDNTNIVPSGRASFALWLLHAPMSTLDRVMSSSQAPMAKQARSNAADCLRGRVRPMCPNYPDLVSANDLRVFAHDLVVAVTQHKERIMAARVYLNSLGLVPQPSEYLPGLIAPVLKDLPPLRVQLPADVQQGLSKHGRELLVRW